ncbi:MAG: CocE/NonD family hydrolase [Acidobacteriia bacterium]|nr:CocE/NonD family hydrolase [Terriglobia bacterium]
MKRQGLILFVLTGTLWFPPAGASAQSAHADTKDKRSMDEEYNVGYIRNVMVPMRDGVKLATDIYFPATKEGTPMPGRFPTLVNRTPYGKGAPPPTVSTMTPEQQKHRNTPTFFASRGYVVVVQDCRGQFDSEGTFYIDVNEGSDGYDTVEWAAKQSWSNGKIGTYGGSYSSQVQNAMAVLRPPHLFAMFVMVGASDYFEEGAYRGGAFTLLHNLVYPMTFASNSQEAMRDPAIRAAMLEALSNDHLGAWLSAYPFRPNASPVAASPINQKWFQDQIDHFAFDDYWKQNGYNFEVNYDKYPDIPIYFLSGWYDLFEHGSLHNFMAMAAMHKSPTKLIMGPWVHGIGTRGSGDVDFGPTAEVTMLDEENRWFDQILKGVNTGVLQEPSVRVFVMGGGDGSKTLNGRMEDGGQWYATTAWPPPASAPHAYYLHADGSLNEQMPATEAASVYPFDPHHPVPTIGGQIDSGKNFSPDGPRNQKCNLKIPFCDNELPLASRPDVLVFQTPPLDFDTVIAGNITVDLWVSSSALDTDFTAKLVDVAPGNRDFPDGFAMNLEDRIVRVRLSPDRTKPQLLQPGEVRKISIDLLGVANRFKKGHRIRLDVSSSNFPFFDVNSNTGERPGYQTHMAVAINTVYHDKDHPSHINLPLLPVSALTTQTGAVGGTSAEN